MCPSTVSRERNADRPDPHDRPEPIHVPQHRRRPIWSDALTEPLAAAIPAGRRPIALGAIKAIHTLAFGVIGGAILVFTWDGLTRRQGRRAGAAAVIGVAESLVYASNNLVCPLTPLAEELGADSGSVTDIYLPEWISDRVPLIGGSTLALGLLLHAVDRWRRARPLVP
jgi:hypothetical protein